MALDSPIELYGAPTGNCLRVAIAIEEAALPYVVRRVNLRDGEHRREPFLSLNPFGKVPVIVQPRDGSAALVLAQSNAIMLHLAERAPGTLLPEGDAAGRAIALERFLYFITDVIAPNHAGFFLRGKQMSDAAAMLDERTVEKLSGAERFVAESSFMAGDRFTLADISAFTIAAAVKEHLPWAQLRNLKIWFDAIEKRPSVVRGYRALGMGAQSDV